MSAKFCTWEVVIFNPVARAREYMWEQKKRISYSFQCMLVSTADPTQYVLGDSHGRGMTEAKLKVLEGKFQAGHVFRMTKVVFAENTKQQYNSAPKTEVVSMQNTDWHPVLVSAGKPKMAEPPVPVSESMSIEHEQYFDVLSLIQNMSEINKGGVTPTGQERVRCTILVNDGSRHKDTGKVCHMPLTIHGASTSFASSGVSTSRRARSPR